LTHRPYTSEILEAAIYANNLDAAEEFYGEILGFSRITRFGNRHIFFRFNNTVLLVFNPEETMIPSNNPVLPVPPHGAVGQGHVCFLASPAQLDEWVRYFESLPVVVEADFLWPNGGRSIYVRDPAGNSIEFAEKRLWFPNEKQGIK